MATPKKKATKAASPAKVTRIKANDANPTKTSAKSASKKSTAKPVVEPVASKSKRPNPFKAFAGYFAGAWYELRQVRWPDRRATWGMTVALLIFVAFFVTLILLLDSLFQTIFQTLVA